MPLSATSSHTRSGVQPAVSTIRPPSGVYLMALDRTFITTWEIRSRSARMAGKPPVPSRRRVWPPALGLDAHGLAALLQKAGEGEGSQVQLAVPRVKTGTG